MKMEGSTFLKLFGLTMFVALLPNIALATTGGGGGTMPWVAPLAALQGAMTGPTAGAIALVAIAVAGAMLIFGGEINAFARTAIYIVLVLGLLVTANTFLSGLGYTGATIPADAASVCFASIQK